ncbi:MAG TPA: Na+/H+ antiporter [Opitutaceae bacterium]
MPPLELTLLLILLIAILSLGARWFPWPQPITYVIGGVIAAFLPGFPQVRLNPEFFFLCFLPPLLFSDGWLMPLRDFGRYKRSILLLATGLVVFTTIGVGLLAHWLFPDLPLAMGFALGAVISPTDAVAVSAITEKLKVPSRLNTILNGESLMNDATGLVAFKFALAALVVGTFSIRAAVVEFFLVALGGLFIGLVIGFLAGKIRDMITRWQGADPMIEITLSLLTPYAAFLLADHLNASAILAVVAAGLYSGWRDPLSMDVETRQTSYAVWSIVIFWLNGLAFVLLGLQFPHLLAAVTEHYSAVRLAGDAVLIAVAAMFLRVSWFFPGAYLPFYFSRRVRENEFKPTWQAVLVGGWAGMRGTVTLAAALSIPMLLPDGSPFPGRDLVIFLSFCVVASTLLLQGTTMAWLIRKLGVREDGIRQKEDRLARKTAVGEGLKRLKAITVAPEKRDELTALNLVIAEYEQRLSELAADGEARTTARLRNLAGYHFRFDALQAERHAIDDLWRRDVISDEVHRPLQQLLDHEESMLQAKPIQQEGEDDVL